MSDSGVWHAQLVVRETATTDVWHAERRARRNPASQPVVQPDTRAAEPERTPR